MAIRSPAINLRVMYDQRQSIGVHTGSLVGAVWTLLWVLKFFHEFFHFEKTIVVGNSSNQAAPFKVHVARGHGGCRQNHVQVSDWSRHSARKFWAEQFEAIVMARRRTADDRLRCLAWERWKLPTCHHTVVNEAPSTFWGKELFFR